MWKNINGLASGFYLIVALTSGLEPPIMIWYSHKNKQIFIMHTSVHIIIGS